MKFNLKTFPACENPVDCMVLDWLRGFEAELKEWLKYHSIDKISAKQIIKEILGE